MLCGVPGGRGAGRIASVGLLLTVSEARMLRLDDNPWLKDGWLFDANKDLWCPEPAKAWEQRL